MFPRWYRHVRIGSVLAFVLMGAGLAALRAYAPPKLSLTPPMQLPKPITSGPLAMRPISGKACRGWPLLVGHDSAGAPRRAYVRAVVDGRESAMLLDTGSARSFVRFDLDADAAVARAQVSVHIGDEDRMLSGRRSASDPDAYGAIERDRLPIDGTLGAEEVLGGTTEIDLRDACLTRHPLGFVVDEASGWPALRLHVVNGVILTNVEIDEKSWPVLFDTGVGNTIVVTEDTRPFFYHQVVLDVRAHPIDLYRRMGTFRWGESRVQSVPIDQTPRFDTFDALKIGDVHAMAGINAMGLRRIIVDPEREVLLIEPLE